MSVSWTQASLALLLLLLRTYTNVFIVKSFKWDYFWAMASLVRIHCWFNCCTGLKKGADHKLDW